MIGKVRENEKCSYYFSSLFQGQIHQVLGNHIAAIEAFNRAVSLQPTNAEYYVRERREREERQGERDINRDRETARQRDSERQRTDTETQGQRKRQRDIEAEAERGRETDRYDRTIERVLERRGEAFVIITSSFEVDPITKTCVSLSLLSQEARSKSMKALGRVGEALVDHERSLVENQKFIAMKAKLLKDQMK